MANPAKAYLTTQVETTTKGELLLMLYEAAIKFLKRAKVEMEKKDYAQKGIYISKAMDVISELANSLNKERGGEITTNLHSLYMFCNIHLAKANIKMDPKMLDEIIKILDGIRSAYAQVVPSVEKGTPTNLQAAAQAQSTSQTAPATPSAKPVATAPEAPPTLSAEEKDTPLKATPEATPTSIANEKSTAATMPPQEEEKAIAVAEQKAKAPMPEVRPMVNPTRLRAKNAYANNR